ncbi:MAG TPA: endoglucanase [Thermotogae bacterium]|nr:endoglucanase [Thermotogota bacterium]
MIMTVFLFFTLFANLLFGQGSLVELVKPFSTARIDLSGVPFLMELNLWNLKSYEGEARLVYKDGVVDFWCSIEEATLLNPSSWVWAYPEIYHGYKPWAGKRTDSPILHLPERLKSVPAFSVEIEYELSHDENLPVNFSLESWFTRRQYPRSVAQGDAEVMIWIYHNNLKPAGKKVGEVPIFMFINGIEVPTIWEIWYALMDWDYVAFRIKNPIREGKMRLPVFEFFREANKVLSRYSKRVSSLEELYLEDLELGSEFGSPHVTKASLSWTLRRFVLHQNHP